MWDYRLVGVEVDGNGRRRGRAFGVLRRVGNVDILVLLGGWWGFRGDEFGSFV